MIGGKVKIFSSLGVRVAQQGCGDLLGTSATAMLPWHNVKGKQGTRKAPDFILLQFDS